MKKMFYLLKREISILLPKNERATAERQAAQRAAANERANIRR